MTYQYIVLSYNHISSIRRKIEQIVKNKRDSTEIFLCGEKDGLCDIIISKLRSLNEPYRLINDIDKVVTHNGEHIIIVWNPEIYHQKYQMNVCNILNNI